MWDESLGKVDQKLRKSAERDAGRNKVVGIHFKRHLGNIILCISSDQVKVSGVAQKTGRSVM